MWFATLLSALVGTAIVVQNATQATLMRKANSWLLLAVGNLVVASICVALFFTQRMRGGLADEVGKIPLLVMVPALCGLVIVAGMPMAISRMGVFPVVMLVIGCQIMASFAWDWYAGQPPTLTRALGAALVVAGLLLVSRPSK